MMFGKNTYPELVYDEDAIRGSIFNILTTPIGSRAFVPEYGSRLYSFIQKPIDNISTQQIFVFLVQAIQRWEPRVELIQSGSFVEKTEDGFFISLQYYILPVRRRSAFQLGVSR